MRPEKHTRQAYVEAFAEIVRRIAATLVSLPPALRPIRMYVAGGAALHFYTGARVSRDVDAVFSHRITLPDDLQISYAGTDGKPTTLYFDTQYNDTLGLLHEDAREDSRPLRLPEVDARVLDVRLLSPVDLAVSKLSRWSSQDQDDVASLARHGLVGAEALRRRAKEALAGYIGDNSRIETTIELAVRLVEGAARGRR